MVFEHVFYFADFGPPAPLNHLWSLAIEEQFYIVWPFLLLLGARLVRDPRRPSGVRPRLAAATAGLAAASAVAMAVLYEPSLDPSRVYYGTDTRACELLVIGLMVWRTSQYSPILYQGGFALLAVATALLVAALAHPACRLGTVLGWAPLRWIGVRSYGIYLWHYPIIVLTGPPGADGPDLLRDVLQLAAILAVAALSWRFVEEPIRHGVLGRVWGRLRTGEWRVGRMPRWGWPAAAGSAGVLLVAGAGMAGLGGRASEAAVPGSVHESRTVRVQTKAADGRPEPCRAVIHIGDSTSEGLTSTNYLPVLWVNVKSLVESGPYAAQNMRAWDKALLEVCPDYPNMRDFDWAAAVRDGWFIDDGIHFTTPGYGARGRLIADALRDAFPPNVKSPGCLIR